MFLVRKELDQMQEQLDIVWLKQVLKCWQSHVLLSLPQQALELMQFAQLQLIPIFTGTQGWVNLNINNSRKELLHRSLSKELAVLKK